MPRSFLGVTRLEDRANPAKPGLGGEAVTPPADPMDEPPPMQPKPAPAPTPVQSDGSPLPVPSGPSDPSDPAKGNGRALRLGFDRS